MFAYIIKDDECKVLWCKADDHYQNDYSMQCVTTNTKWADGTPCGTSEPTVVIFLQI